VTAITGGGWVLCEVKALSHGMEDNPMRIIGLAIVAATAFGVWSASPAAQSRVGKADVLAASAPISPHVTMWH